MKRIILALAILLPTVLMGQEERPVIRAGGGYVRDFPGLDGLGCFAEYSHPMNENLQAAFGFKWNNLQGFPRTNEVKEFTKGITIDFDVYFLPFVHPNHQVRVGAGYSFSFYDIRRSYPVIVNDGGTLETHWPIQDSKGSASGFNLMADYEYRLPNSNVSFGPRISLYKSFDYVFFAGGMIGIRI
jgi:hypothetical protein